MNHTSTPSRQILIVFPDDADPPLGIPVRHPFALEVGQSITIVVLDDRTIQVSSRIGDQLLHAVEDVGRTGNMFTSEDVEAAVRRVINAARPAGPEEIPTECSSPVSSPIKRP